MQNSNTTTTETMQCLIDGHHGVYVPQVFATAFQTADWGITEEQAEVLRHGPDHANADDRDDPQEVYAEQCWGELYWEIWGTVLNNAEWRDGEGNLWHLHQDSDLFAVRADHDHDNI